MADVAWVVGFALALTGGMLVVIAFVAVAGTGVEMALRLLLWFAQGRTRKNGR